MSQSYKNYEIIVVDDGSPDNLASLVQSRYPQLRLIRQENRGLAGARNTGIDASRGEYVAFLDSDDKWLPTKLEIQATDIIKNPEASVFYSDCFYWEDGVSTRKWSSDHQLHSDNFVIDLINRKVAIPVLTSVVKKEALISVNGFNEKRREVEDYDLWLRLALTGNLFIGNDNPTALYRINPNGLSSNMIRMARAHISVYSGLLSHRNLSKTIVTAIKKQIKIFSIEALHQERRVEIKGNHRFRAMLKTIQMVPIDHRLTAKKIAESIAVLLLPNKYS
jgi:glycosyltransferase involved in cell wall biosynthesis